jgi:hypothetical protein
VFTVKTYKENLKGERVVIKGDSELVYSPDKPLSCGAKVWIETEQMLTYFSVTGRLHDEQDTSSRA